MTDKQYELIGHSLGVKIDKYNGDKTLPNSYYRNFFQAGDNHPDYWELITMVKSGLMTQSKPFGMPVFYVSEKGKDVFEREFKLKNHARK